MQSIRVSASFRLVQFAIALLTCGITAYGQTFWQEVGIRRFETFDGAKTYCTNSLNSDQCERASIIPAQTLGTYPYAYPAHALTYLLVYPMEHSESPDAMVAGYSNALPTESYALSPCLYFLDLWTTTEHTTLSSAFTAFGSLDTTIQKTGAASIASPYISQSTTHALLYRARLSTPITSPAFNCQ